MNVDKVPCHSWEKHWKAKVWRNRLWRQRYVPVQVTGLGYVAMYSSAGYFLIKGIAAAQARRIQQHQANMVRLVGLSWGVSPLGRLLTVTPPIIWFPGTWNNAAVVCLSWPLGIYIAQHWMLGKPQKQEKAQSTRRAKLVSQAKDRNLLLRP